MTPRMRRHMILLWLVLACGCAFGQQAGHRPPAEQQTQTTPEAYIQRAQMHEKRAELRQAMLAWQVAATLSDQPNAEISAAIDRLKTRIQTETKAHFQKGLADYQAGKMTAARNEFLKTLRLAPQHRGARYYLKVRLHGKQQNIYRVKRGDSYSKIAVKTYKDVRKAYLIAYFNDRNPHKPLLTGTILLLPALDPHFLEPRKEINDWVAQARLAMEREQYDTVISLTARINKAAPGHSDAMRMTNEAYYQQGMTLIAQKQYLAALEKLKKVGRSHKGRDDAIKQARRQIRQQALDEKLRTAEDYLKQGKYSSVINVSEEVLQQSPENPQARELYNAANYALGKQLLEQGEEAMAAELLKVVDPSHKDTEELLSLALARMRAQSETFYRSGVKHFINEDLERAVTAWERALSLNPKHPKARQDIENAKRILKKWRAINQEKTGTPKDQ